MNTYDGFFTLSHWWQVGLTLPFAILAMALIAPTVAVFYLVCLVTGKKRPKSAAAPSAASRGRG